MSRNEFKKPWCYIPIKGGQRAKIDTEDYERVSQHTWYITTAKSGRQTPITNLKTAKGYRLTTLGKFLINPPKGKFVYPRRFMEGFDFRKENLVTCTMAERQQMLPKSRHHGSSQYKGVSYSNRLGLWQAGIQYDGKTVHLGVFKSEIEAAEAYNVAARKFFGEFGYQNQTGNRSDRRHADTRKKKR